MRLTSVIMLFFLIASALSATPRPYDVVDYDVDLEVDLPGRSLSGWATITLVATSRTTEITLDAPGIVVNHVLDSMRPCRYRSTAEHLFVYFDTPVDSGSVRRLLVRYHATPQKGISFRNDQVYTAFHTERWLPCNADPSDRATLSLALTFPAKLRLVANGRRLSNDRASPDHRRERWRCDLPYPAYLFGFAVARFVDTTLVVDSVRLRYLGVDISAAELTRVFAGTPSALAFFTARAGMPLPGGAYAQALVDGNVAQELATLATIRRSYANELLAEPREDWLVAHELAHQWWGNWVTCRSWSEIWLNEGFATFMTAAFKEVRWGADEYAREIYLARARYDRARRAGADRALRYDGWSSAEEANGVIPYFKGALVLHLLRRQLGDEIFWKGVRDYTISNAGRSVTSKELEASMERASGEKLGWFFDQWVYASTAPEVIARHRVEKGKVVIELEQRGTKRWRIDLDVAIETSRGRERHHLRIEDSITTRTFPLVDTLLSVRIDDGGALPIVVEHRRPLPMLFHQSLREPDAIGRADAVQQLKLAMHAAATETKEPIARALRQIATSDSSRLVRQAAE